MHTTPVRDHTYIGATGPATQPMLAPAEAGFDILGGCLDKLCLACHADAARVLSGSSFTTLFSSSGCNACPAKLPVMQQQAALWQSLR